MSVVQVDAVYAALVRAAQNGQRAPTNDELCAAGGFASPATAARIVAELERRGLLRVERFQCARVITVVKLGLSIASGSNRSPHWRNGVEKARATAIKPIRAEVLVTQDVVEPGRVDRDPCPRCGVRGDIGCHHSRAPISMGAFA